MVVLVQTILNMILLAAVYILAATGFAFMLNLLGIFNLAHGSYFMASGYVCYLLVTGLDLSIWLAFPVTVILVGLVGMFVEKYLFRPFLGDFDRMVMICIVMSTVLITSFNLALGTRTINLPPFISGRVGVEPYLIETDRILLLAVSFVVLTALTLFVTRSKWGIQMQAMTQDREGAVIQGMRPNRVASISCAVGFALAAVAGIFSGSLYNLSPFAGDAALSKAIMLVIVAGVGSLKGIFLMGALLGIMYGGLPVILPGAWVDAVASIFVITLLLLRPQGFFGHEQP